MILILVEQGLYGVRRSSQAGDGTLDSGEVHFDLFPSFPAFRLVFCTFHQCTFVQNLASGHSKVINKLFIRLGSDWRGIQIQRVLYLCTLSLNFDNKNIHKNLQ